MSMEHEDNDLFEQKKKEMLEKVRKCFKENAMDLYLYHCKGADIDDVTDDFMSRLKSMMEDK